MSVSRSSAVVGSWKDIFLNVDLHALTPVYLDQLDIWKPLYDAISVTPHHLIAERLSRIIYRYERLWLPLLAEWKTSPDPEPPADVHWIWQLHQLRAKQYGDYCRTQYGKLLPHRLRPARATETCMSIQQTSTAWRQRYPDEPYELPPGSLGGSEEATSVRRSVSHLHCRLTELLAAAALHDVDFVHQVALPHMRDADFLYVAVERYRKMLLLRRKRPGDAAVVRLPVDVQLILRVHALHPVQFNDDMRRLLGDASVPDCDPDCDVSPLLVDKSNTLWRLEFHSDTLFIAGTSARGRAHPDGNSMTRFPRETFMSRAVESCDVTFTSVTVEELWSHSGIKRVVVEARLLGENSFAQDIVFKQSGTVGVPIGGGTSGGGPSQSLGTTHFDVQRNRGIELVVDGRQGIGCFARRRNLSTKLFNPVQHCSQSATSLTVSLPKVTYTDPKITISFDLKAATPKPHIFTFDRNPSSLRPVATDLRPFVAPVRVWSNVMGSPDSLFLHARHGLKCRDGGLAFGVEVIKQEQTNLAAVLVYHNNQNLVAAAYSIDSDMLPDPCQVSETCPLSYDAQEDDHAMLIRNHQGDFAVCVARRMHTPAASGSDMECKISFKIYFVQTRQSCKFDVRDDEMEAIKVSTTEGSVEVDLPTGKLKVEAQVEPLSEYLALAFTVGILFVTIQKTSFQATSVDNYPTGSMRSLYSTPGRSSPVPSEASRRSGASRMTAKTHISNQKKNKAANKRRKMSASFTFLLACGLQVDVALYGNGTVNGGGSVGRTSLGSFGRHGNGVSNNGTNHVANGTLGSYPQFQQQQQQHPPSTKRTDDRIMMDVRL